MFKPKYVWKILRAVWNIHQDSQINSVEFLQGNFLLVWILNLPTETNLLRLYMLQYTKDTGFTNNNASISMPPTPTHRALQSFPSTNMHRKNAVVYLWIMMQTFAMLFLPSYRRRGAGVWIFWSVRCN